MAYGTDAHGRNYSILLGASGRMQLAPLYDLISALPYRPIKEHTINLSMLIGPTRHAASIDAVAWRALAEQCALAWARVHDTVGTTVQAIHDAAPMVCTAARADGAPPDFAGDFEKRLTSRARRCLYLLGKRRA